MKQIEVSAAVIQKDNLILAAKRNYGEFEGMWEFPGGKIEKNETQKQALQREISEEFSVNIIINEYITTVEYDYPTFHLTMHCYHCQLPEGQEIHLSVHEDIIWANKEELLSLEWLPADLPIVEHIINDYL